MMRVLVVEDDDVLRESLVDLMRLEGVEATVAVGSLAEMSARGGDALACDLAIVDVNLGDGVPSGIDAFRWLRERAFAGRVVFLTGHARWHPLVKEAGAIAGVTVLDKPVGIDALRALVTTAAEERA